MAVPTHRPSCQVLVYGTKCWHCGVAIHVLQCSCGSVALFDSLGGSWPKHACGPGAGIGGSGLSGWSAVDALAAAGASITPDVMKKVFPSYPTPQGEKKRQLDIVSVSPSSDRILDVIGVVREIVERSKQTKYVDGLGTIGRKMLGIPADARFWQITLVDNSSRPNLSYTCLVSTKIESLHRARNKLVYVRLRSHGSGNHAVWLVENAELL